MYTTGVLNLKLYNFVVCYKSSQFKRRLGRVLSRVFNFMWKRKVKLPGKNGTLKGPDFGRSKYDNYFAFAFWFTFEPLKDYKCMEMANLFLYHQHNQTTTDILGI